MRPKIFSKKLFLAFFVLFLASVLFLQPVFAVECAPGVSPVPCPEGAAFCRPCDPPSLQNLETLAVQTLGVVWVMTGLIFFVLFIYNAYLYMFNKVEDSKKRMTQWVIGLLMVLFAQPVVATFMKFLVADGTSCYEALRQPSFTFFFPQVCSDVTVTVGPTPVGNRLKCVIQGVNQDCYRTQNDNEYVLMDQQTVYCAQYDEDTNVASQCFE